MPIADALVIHGRSAVIFDALEELGTLGPSKEQGQLKAHPEIFISFDIATLQELASAVAERRGDLGIIDANAFEPMIGTNAACLLPATRPLAAKKVTLTADLEDVECVGIKRRLSLRGGLDQTFSDPGAKPRFVIETDAVRSTLDSIREGLGVSVLNCFPIVLDLAEGGARPFNPSIPVKNTFRASWLRATRAQRSQVH